LTADALNLSYRFYPQHSCDTPVHDILDTFYFPTFWFTILEEREAKNATLLYNYLVTVCPTRWTIEIPLFSYVYDINFYHNEVLNSGALHWHLPGTIFM
jgi:hypothetical protein